MEQDSPQKRQQPKLEKIEELHQAITTKHRKLQWKPTIKTTKPKTVPPQKKHKVLHQVKTTKYRKLR